MTNENSSDRKAEVREKVLTFLKTNFPKIRNSEIGFDDPLLKKGLIDSLGILSIISFVDEEFRITVDDAEVNEENFDTINGIIGYIMKKTGEV